MDRTIVYPGSIPQDTDILSLNRNAMLAVGYLAQATLGANVVADGLSCTPTAPASMAISIGPGSITSFGPVDANPYGSLPADTTDMVVKMGINLGANSFTLSAPSGTGTAINYLIEANFLESDTNPVVLPYYNAANPAQPFSGMGNNGAAQNTLRVARVQLRLVAGAAAPAGQQATPAPDAGWMGLYVVTVSNAMTSIGSGAIALYPQAPFLPFKLPQLTPGHSAMAVIATTQSWTPPFGVRLVKLRMAGGGGGGGSGGGGGGGGGAGGGSVEGYYPVTPGTPILCTVGAGGGPGVGGGASSFGALAVAGGGGPGANGAANAGGAGSASGGTGSGTGLLLNGGAGQNGFANAALSMGGGGGVSGFGGGAPGALVAAGSAAPGQPGVLPGAGGAGGVGSGAGGPGAAGVIVLQW